MKKELPEKLMDVRLRDKFLSEGKITKAQVDEYLNSLPDDTEKMNSSAQSEGSDLSTNPKKR